MHIAAEKGWDDCVEFLCSFPIKINKTEQNDNKNNKNNKEKEINLDVKDKKGKTALHYSISNNFKNISTILVKSGCLIDVEDNEGNNALSICSLKECFYFKSLANVFDVLLCFLIEDQVFASSIHKGME